MDHKEIREMLQLYVMKELNPEEVDLVINHISECDKCRDELRSLSALYKAMSENKPVLPDNLNLEARQQLGNFLRNDNMKKSRLDNIWNEFSNLFWQKHKIAFSGAVSLMVGIFIGYLFFFPRDAAYKIPSQRNMIDIQEIDEADVQISNIRFKNPFVDNGEIEIDFDAIKPISYSGNINDELTQRLLAAAILNTTNTGVKIKTLNTLAMKSEDNFVYDETIKKALITSLKVDENAGVRREALNVLRKYPFDEEIKNALLYVLSNDQNSGLRVAAINALVDTRVSDVSLDNEFKNILNNRVEADPNEYVRLRAALLLEEEK